MTQADDDFPFDDELDEDDIFAEAEANCGSRRAGQCDLAGTEYCDWSCPLSGIVFRRSLLAQVEGASSREQSKS